MIGWYINRLKTLSLPEYPYRMKQMIQKQIEKRTYKKRKHLTNYQYFGSTQRILEFDGFGNALPSKQNLNYFIFGHNFGWEAGAINWHLDIFTKKTFPKTFSKDIFILKDPLLSAKVVWEINRHQFLMKEVISFNVTKDTDYLNRFIDILKSWIEENPYLTGINWYSNIEVNLRLINWFLFWELLDMENLMNSNQEVAVFVNDFWLPSIYEHCYYSYHNPSLYSSANNHLISEYAGLFVASSKWKFKESDHWKKYAKKGLEKEIGKQHSKNGINKEEAAEYIQFITDFFLIAKVVGDNTNNSFSNEYNQRLEKIIDYIYHFLDIEGNFPQYGDEDDGWCFRFDFEKGFNNFRSLLTSGAIMYNMGKLKSKSNGLDIKNQILFGTRGEETFNSLSNVIQEEPSKFYREEGHFYFRKKEGKNEIYLHFDAAPLGFLSIAAHGHADALSVLLHLDGDPILVDPGTYTYHTELEWRAYFLSTLAHNTICIDGQNQALQGGPTLWLTHYKTKVEQLQKERDSEFVLATHDGYKRIGCSHKRGILFVKSKNEFIITDEIECKGESQSVLQPWHLHPEVEVDRIDAQTFILKHKSGKRRIRLQLDPLLDIQLIYGQEDPILGWYSKSFMKKQKTFTLLGKVQGKDLYKVNLQTKIEVF